MNVTQNFLMRKKRSVRFYKYLLPYVIIVIAFSIPGSMMFSWEVFDAVLIDDEGNEAFDDQLDED